VLKKWQISALEEVDGWNEFANREFPSLISSAANKKLLLVMAGNGEPRPVPNKHPLGNALSTYTCPSRCYDDNFYQQIKILAPHWFVDTAAENKRQLLEMARNGDAKPKRNQPLGVVLVNYTCQGSGCYDAEFDTEIRKTTSWFVNTATEKKRQLLEMAIRGEPRPSQKKHPLGNSINDYTSKNKSTYDPDFDKQIRKLVPHWFKGKLNAFTTSKF